MLIFFSGSCNQTFSLKYIVKWETSSRILIEHYLLVSLTLKKKGERFYQNDTVT